MSGGHNHPYEHRADVYHPNEGWKEFPALPEGRSRFCQVTVDDKIYSIGGKINTIWGNSPPYTVWVNSPPYNESWTDLGYKMNGFHARHSCAVWGGRIYVIGGLYGSFSDYDELVRKTGTGRSFHLEKSRTVEIFDPSNPGDWLFGPELPEPVQYGHAFVYNDVLYATTYYEDEDDERFIRFYSLGHGDQQWKLAATLPTKDYESQRHVFPAPVLKANQLHCKN